MKISQLIFKVTQGDLITGSLVRTHSGECFTINACLAQFYVNNVNIGRLKQHFISNANIGLHAFGSY